MVGGEETSSRAGGDELATLSVAGLLGQYTHELAPVPEYRPGGSPGQDKENRRNIAVYTLPTNGAKVSCGL